MASQEQYKAVLEQVMSDTETGAISKEAGIDMVQQILDHWYKNWANGTLTVEDDETTLDFITDKFSTQEDIAYEDALDEHEG